MPNHYSVLGCTSDSSYAEIKKCYQDLVLKFHPDKNVSNNSVERFHEIDEAWKVLREPLTRKAYDDHLRQIRLEESDLLLDTFSLKDLKFCAESKTYTHDCRCGGVYRISTEDCQGFDSILSLCEQCSLMISVILE